MLSTSIDLSQAANNNNKTTSSIFYTNELLCYQLFSSFRVRLESVFF